MSAAGSGLRDPLQPFVFLRQAVPYATPYGTVTSAQSKSGFAVARTGSIAHRVDALAYILEDNRARFGARWVCGSGTLNAVPISDLAPFGDGVCVRCNESAWPVVYRCFDAARRLLYIGSSGQFSARKSMHAKESRWWPQVAEIVCETFDTITEARLAERLAIQSEHPLHNVRHRARPA